MYKGVLLGIIGGLIIFLILLSFIIYSDSDFDEQLINEVNDGDQVNTLLFQIDDETQKMENNANRRYLSVIMDKKYWGNGDLAKPEDYQYYTKNHENDLKRIEELEYLRKQFVKREINKEQFLISISFYKDYFKIYN
ncbi:MAG: hypothetical protein ACP5OJ_05480 [Methanothermobacter sp.]